MVHKLQLQRQLEQAARRQGWKGEVILGLADGRARKAVKTDYLYLDHAYFNRGWERGMFRLTRGWHHLTDIKPRPDDRLKLLRAEIEPWRKTGSKIIVIPPSSFQAWFAGDWLNTTVSRLKEITDRPISVKMEKGNFREYCSDAWALVTWASAAGVDAAMMGIPVFSTEKCPSSPVCAGPLENIEKPEYKERHEWACSIAYACWHVTEMHQIELGNYDYSRRHDLS